MNFERRTATEGVELREEGNTMTAIGYASVFNRLSQNLGGFVERVAQGTFAKTIQEADVRALFNHDADQVLGRSKSGTLRMQEDEKGLRYEIDLPNTQLGRDLAVLLERGDVSGSSFGFQTVSDEWGTTEDGYPLRTLTEVKLRDVSPCVFPAYEASEASLRSLSEERSIDLAILVDAAERNDLRSVLDPQEEEDETEPSETHSVVKRSWGIR